MTALTQASKEPIMQVLCLSRSVLPEVPSMACTPFNFNEQIAPEDSHFIDRSLVDDKDRVEWASEVPQVIPYIVVMNNKGDIFSYSRHKDSSEQRLAGSRSIGFGGHVDMTDVSQLGAINTAACRELHEELELDPHNYVLDVHPNILIDNTNDVGRVHVGIVMVATIQSEVAPAEDEITAAEWHTLDEITADKASYENWSQLVIEHLHDRKQALKTAGAGRA